MGQAQTLMRVKDTAVALKGLRDKMMKNCKIFSMKY